MFHLINRATRVGKTRAYLFDHIWTNCIEGYNGSGVVMSDITDHYLTFVMINKEPSFVDTDKYILIKKRIFSEEGGRTMNNLLGNTDWSLLQDSDNINGKYGNLYSIWYSHFDRVFPIVSNRIKIIDIVIPYITKELKDLIVEKRRLLKLYKRWPITHDNIYKTFNIYDVNMRLKTPMNVISMVGWFNNCDQPKDYWNFLRDILGRKKTTALVLNY